MKNNMNKSTKSGSRPGAGQNQPQRNTTGKRAPVRNSKVSSNNPKGAFGRTKGVSAAYSQKFSSKEPRIAYSKSGCCVSHTELIGDIAGTSSADFTQAVALQLNPGLSTFTPWLANIAQNYESYRCKKLHFRYVTKTGSTTAGSVMMIPDYNASDSAPISEQLAANYIDVQEDVPWVQEGIRCVLRPQAMHKIGPLKFIRTGPLAPNLDIKTYDVGSFWVFTVNSSSAAGWGKLWVDYEFEFETPTNKPSSAASETWVVECTGNGGDTTSLPFGTVPIFLGGIAHTYSPDSGLTTFPVISPGELYYLTMVATDAAGTITVELFPDDIIGFDVLGFASALADDNKTSIYNALLQANSNAGSFIPAITTTTIDFAQFVLSIAPSSTPPGFLRFPHEKKKTMKILKKEVKK